MSAWDSNAEGVNVISHERLSQFLEAENWEKSIGRGGLYLRFSPPNEGYGRNRVSVVVPVDRAASDYDSLLAEALSVVARVRGDRAGESLLDRLIAPTETDEYSFAKDTSAPRGWIQWDEGVSLIKSARALLAAGAKSAREPMAYYGNRYGQFANRFLDEVMMGQTAVSSYVVRAYVPTQTAIPFQKSADNELNLFGDADGLTGRDISRSVVTVLEATVEALEHHKSHQSLSAFTAPDTPLSYESVQAVRAVAENADDSAIRVAWEGATDESSHNPKWEFNFTAASVPVLEQAASILVTPEPQRRVVARGTVHLLSRSDAEGPGVVGITTFTGIPANKLRVRLSRADYHRALGAHDRGAFIEVVGDFEREGNLSWLYNAQINAIQDQASIFDD